MLSRHHVAGSWESSTEYALLCFVNGPNGRGVLWRRASTWSAAVRLQISWKGWYDMHVNESRLIGKQLQQKTTFALRFSLSSEILAFRYEHRPNAEQLNCWVYAFKLTFVSSWPCVELTLVSSWLVSSWLFCKWVNSTHVSSWPCVELTATLSISTRDSTSIELRLALTITLTLTDTGFAVLTLLLGYRRRCPDPNASIQIESPAVLL